MSALPIREGHSATPLMSLDPLLAAARAAGASDLHVSAGKAALVRLGGELVALDGFVAPLPGDWLAAALTRLMRTAQQAEFEVEGETDLSYSLPYFGRFRVNVFRQLDGIAAAFRLVPAEIPSLASLGVPEVASRLAMRSQGLVLVTGPAGAGKSTTLAAMIDLVNRQRAGHIITVEDPIEFVHQSHSCLVHQREIGRDARTFAAALRSALRQDPDVVMIGELRDPETISIALTAAETGHLVLSTMHTQGAAKSIDRIIDSVRASQQAQVRAQLGETLQGVISQVLMPGADGSSRVLATEVLVHTHAVANLIRESQVSQLLTVMQTSSNLGMHTMEQSLIELVRAGRVSAESVAGYLAQPLPGTDAAGGTDASHPSNTENARSW
ncbi:type IV pilus twitching motility protein PilT [Propionicimonas sp.]|uniref:type IV pilus twitching motility protein PilT n=1 Tax=Propionicimonas sp. TaxID=1955623 RepID=UPI0025F69E61|nr:PilT/PilU family type 4a pilus ATPase [Propionicimonas sp.]MCG2803966.1 PilT/PilU family type 4a pilus ATPase [Propionicimonas sp.]